MGDDSPTIGTRVSRKERDRFTALATALGMSVSDCLRRLIYEATEAAFASDIGLEDLLRTKRKLETQINQHVDDIVVAQATRWTRPPGQTVTETKLVDQFVKTANENGIPVALEGLRAEPEDVRVRVTKLLEREHADLWKKVRPVVAGREAQEAKA